MPIAVTPTHATLGAKIRSVDLADLSDPDWDEIEAAFHEYAVLIFPHQHLSEAAQISFSERFGRIEHLHTKVKAVRVSNQKADGSVATPKEHQSQILRGNEGWHTDSSYMPLAAKASCLSALTLPAWGGQTGWADMRAAYDALDDSLKSKIAKLEAYHSLYHSQRKIGHVVESGQGYGFHTRGAPIRPLIKTHPVTKRKSLFIGRHAYKIPGMDDEEARVLLTQLVEFACQPPRVYVHNWEVGDLCIWDNRCVLHRAYPYDYEEARVLRHTRIAGEPESELVPTGRDELAGGFDAAAG